MSDARDEILSRIRSALQEVPRTEQPQDVTVPRGYQREGHLGHEQVVDLFDQRVSDYRATVRRVARANVSAAVAEACAELGCRSVAVPSELPRQWRPSGVDIVEDNGLSSRQLDELDGVLTGCATAIATTGTLLLDGRGVSGRRLLTLIPDSHICVVELKQVVETVPEALARVARVVQDENPAITLVSGPSASSDIELARVEGVHGPRNLVVLLVG